MTYRVVVERLDPDTRRWQQEALFPYINDDRIGRAIARLVNTIAESVQDRRSQQKVECPS